MKFFITATDKLTTKLAVLLNIDKHSVIQFFKHYFVGGTSAVLNYSMFNLFFIAGGLTVMNANIITCIIIFIFAFFMQKHFTFQVTHHSFKQPLLFLLVSVIYFAADTLLLMFLIDKLAWSSLIAKIVSILGLAPFNFLSQKYIVFKKST